MRQPISINALWILLVSDIDASNNVTINTINDQDR